ncbi:SDR family oxidoreductase [Kineosporia succinea]|uniref:NADP-dependent 3-hydroxy acid dehydrogenase YdfG n=1 Tax=Kineosporia succinea TaxID=84632 RepID=A0ABT9PDS2_9ACTN|nr:SDR family oxidoreductase [Kineosporia succinea]MDP9830857.1 NADP-dependent 3-hydroxy acid dehydrogenase YdfG [Kineosporia succinea]
MSIAGKVVVITGAGSGIGAATAELLAGQGARLVLGGRRADRLEQVAARISGESVGAENAGGENTGAENAGGENTGAENVAWAVTDVRRREDVKALISLARNRFGRMDVLVSNAGVATVAPIETLTDEQVDDMIDVNLKGVVYGITAALPVFREQGGGHFVQTVSTSGLRIVAGQAIYAGAKNAVRTISEALRQEAGPSIRVTAVSPGMIRTEFVGERPPESNPDGVATWDQVQEVAIDASAVARAIAFAIDQPDDVDVNEIVVRPTAQG